MLAYPLGIFAPRGMIVRTTQIVGSFMLLNGLINALTGGIEQQRSRSPSDGGISTPDLLVKSARADLMRKVKLERHKDAKKSVDFTD